MKISEVGKQKLIYNYSSPFTRVMTVDVQCNIIPSFIISGQYLACAQCRLGDC